MDRWLHPLSRIIPSRRQGHGSGFGHEAWPVVVMVCVEPVLQSIWLPPSTSTDLACQRGVTHRFSRLPSLTQRCCSSATVDGGLPRTLSVRRQTVINRTGAEAPQCDPPFPPVSLLLPSATAAQCWLARLPPLPARCGLMAVKNSFLVEVQEAGLPGSHGVGLKEHDSETTRPTAAAQFPPQDLVPQMLLSLLKNKSECSPGH